MKFSNRMQIQPVRTLIQIDSIDESLRNGLWTSICETVLQLDDNQFSNSEIKYSLICTSLWMNFFKYPIDTLPKNVVGDVESNRFEHFLRKWFFNAKWFEVYDLIDFLAQYKIPNFANYCNLFLERELSAYRLIDNQLSPVTSEEEVQSIEESLKLEDKFKNIRIHLKTAINHLSNRENPDFRNSIKESISAVEALCIIITDNTKATLGSALKVLEKSKKFHPSLIKAFSSLYGYTSDSAGIRYALTDDDETLTFDDAKFMLVSCSSFINYLTSKYFTNNSPS